MSSSVRGAGGGADAKELVNSNGTKLANLEKAESGKVKVVGGLGDALPDKVLEGNTFSSESGVNQAGTLGKQEKTITPIPKGSIVVPDAGKLLSKVTLNPFALEGQYVWKKCDGIPYTLTFTVSGSTSPYTLTVDCDLVDLTKVDASWFVGVRGNWRATPKGYYEFINKSTLRLSDGDAGIWDAPIVWNAKTHSFSVTMSTGIGISAQYEPYKNQSNLIDYVVSDNTTEYPNRGEKGKYWYEKIQKEGHWTDEMAKQYLKKFDIDYTIEESIYTPASLQTSFPLIVEKGICATIKAVNEYDVIGYVDNSTYQAYLISAFFFAGPYPYEKPKVSVRGNIIMHKWYARYSKQHISIYDSGDYSNMLAGVQFKVTVYVQK